MDLINLTVHRSNMAIKANSVASTGLGHWGS